MYWSIDDWLIGWLIVFTLSFFFSVNYRGSIGFGEQNLRSLLGKVGENDVEDCFRALDVLLGKWKLTEADTDIFVQGGSHGGFLGAHLIGQFPGIFRASCLRNPVINMASMFGTTDIPDWTFVESGFEYHYDNPPVTPPYLELLKRSPIVYAEKVGEKITNFFWNIFLSRRKKICWISWQFFFFQIRSQLRRWFWLEKRIAEYRPVKEWNFTGRTSRCPTLIS